MDRLVDCGLLPEIYRGWYAQWLVEEVQEITASSCATPSHPHWTSTRDFAGTNEEFYISRSDTTDGGVDEDDDIPEIDEDNVLWMKTMPESLHWLSRIQHQLIPTTQLSTKAERKMFKDNYRRFSVENCVLRTGFARPRTHKNWNRADFDFGTGNFMTKSSSANAYEAVDWAAFAEFWEEHVRNLEKARNLNSGIFRKTSGLLRKYGKEREAVLNKAITIARLSVTSNLSNVRRTALHSDDFVVPPAGRCGPERLDSDRT